MSPRLFFPFQPPASTTPIRLTIHVGPLPVTAGQLRARLLEEMHLTMQWLLRSRSDDTRNLQAAVKVVATAMCWRSMLQNKLSKVSRGYHGSKASFYDSAWGRKLGYRRRLIFRVALQHLRRRASEFNTVPYHALHQALIDDLLDASLSFYANVRRKAQNAMLTALSCIPTAKRDVVPKILRALADAAAAQSAVTAVQPAALAAHEGAVAMQVEPDQADPTSDSTTRKDASEASEAQNNRLKGILHLLIGSVVAKAIARRLEWAQRLFAHLAKLESHEKLR